jgi:hypothetical protein
VREIDAAAAAAAGEVEWKWDGKGAGKGEASFFLLPLSSPSVLVKRLRNIWKGCFPSLL